MKECNCGRIPPCYSGRVFNIYEETKKVKEAWDKPREFLGAVIDKIRATLMEVGCFDDTYHKVYGVNEQLCDLGKTILTKNKDDMEEKKKAKMTKAKAFEWLSNKKIDASINEREVQLKLFSLGVVWCTLDSNPTLGVHYLLIDKECHMTHCGSDWDYYKTHCYEEISADDILSIEIVEEKKEKFVDCSEPCDEIKAVQELLRNSKHLKDKTLVITKDNAAIL